MNINLSPVKYSSIVEIGEKVLEMEKQSNSQFLKLHRGVMDVDTIDINSIINKVQFNSKKFQQYGGNDGDVNLINTIKSMFHLSNHHLMVTPGGMASLDLTINSLSDKKVWVPKYHWGSWNKILQIHQKEIYTFDDFNISEFKPDSGIVLLCYPSNPTGYSASLQELKIFIDYCKSKDITIILDLPYYYLFNDLNSEIYNLYYDNVIILSSFSKSIGLSGFRVGYIATKNKELYDTMRIRSLYKYNSISNPSQFIINELLTSENGMKALEDYKNITIDNIKNNIQYLVDKNLLFDEYTSVPVGPFAIINKTFEYLIENKISSVPLSKFVFQKDETLDKYSRISVAVNNQIFKEYFEKMLK